MPDRTCTVGDCPNPPRSSGAEWCKKHYHRWYRHGSVDTTAVGSRTFVRHYVAVYRPGHPIAPKSGKVYVHRLALFDKIGDGEHPCHWCGTLLRWRVTDEGETPLVVDHLNNDTGDNDPDNLVPACHACNTRRGNKRRSARLRHHGWFQVNDTVGRLAVNRDRHAA